MYRRAGGYSLSLCNGPSKMELMNSRFVFILVLSGLCLAASAQSTAGDSESIERVRRIILHSRHPGAHGMGYNNQSLNTLSQKLIPADIPILVVLLADNHLTVGVEFA